MEFLEGVPGLQELLNLEVTARDNGSGIKRDELIGCWKFLYVWRKGTDKEDFISSFMLRLLSASLELRRNQINSEEESPFLIINSVEFGPFKLSFQGLGYLKGIQPLLPFFFDRIEIKLGTNVFFSREIPKPEEKEQPFFSLIAIDQCGEWLSARGRGGGLAVWLKAG